MAVRKGIVAHMRQSVVYRSLLLAAIPVFALDEKPVLVQGGMEMGLRLGFDATYQMLDDSWAMSSAQTPSAPVAYASEAYFKYGMNEKSDLEVVLPWALRDKDWASQEGYDDSYGGFDRLHLAAKIRLLKKGTAGLIAGFSFPLGHTKVVGFTPEWGFSLGTFGGYRKANWWIDGLGTWSTTPKNSDGFQPGDVTLLTARGGMQLDEGIAPDFGLSYVATGRPSTNGEDNGPAVHKITAIPGCQLMFDEEWTLEVRLPVVVSGANTHATAGLSLGIVGYFEP